LSYQSDSSFSGVFGTAQYLGKNIWNLSYVNASGTEKKINVEIAALFNLPKLNGRVKLGPVAGPNVDWVHAVDPIDYVSYFVGAAGGIGTWEFARIIENGTPVANLGLWAYGKYNFKLTPDDILYKEGWKVGGGLYYNF
jgi:hypothetical protein